MLARKYRLAIAGTSALLLVVLGVLAYQQTKSTQTVPTPTTSAVVTPAEVLMHYRTGLAQATVKLEPLLARPLQAPDQSQLMAVRDQLVALSVPLTYQSYHLQLVLKLSLLSELVTPGRVRAAARGIPTAASTRLELQQLLNSGPPTAQ